jgi:chemotaxis protein methyltransferase WspC
VAFRDRHFQSVREDHVLKPSVRKQVRFHQGNLLEESCLRASPAYDFVFCRNLLIYLDPVHQQKALQRVRQLLAPTGVLFVGAAEMSLALANGFASANLALSFACRPAGPARKPSGSPARSATNPARSQQPRVGIATTPSAARRLPADLALGENVESVRSQQTDLGQAQRLADQGQLAAAAEICEAHLRTCGVSAEAYYLLGLIRAAGGATSQANEFYRRALYLDPGHYETLIQWAVLSRQNGDAARARILQERARRIRPADSNG